MDTARLFVGIEPNDRTRAALAAFRRELDGRAVGKLVDPSLYHLTLCFLGQTPLERIPALSGLLNENTFHPFELSLAGLDTFKNGSILWIGIGQPCEELFVLQTKLSDALDDAGFPVERGTYSPHVTLGRQMKRLGNLPEPPSVSFEVKHITLFESTRIDGRLAYVPLYRSGGR